MLRRTWSTASISQRIDTTRRQELHLRRESNIARSPWQRYPWPSTPWSTSTPSVIALKGPALSRADDRPLKGTGFGPCVKLMQIQWALATDGLLRRCEPGSEIPCSLQPRRNHLFTGFKHLAIEHNRSLLA